jgi:hypothetical protein
MSLYQPILNSHSAAAHMLPLAQVLTVENLGPVIRVAFADILFAGGRERDSEGESNADKPIHNESTFVKKGRTQTFREEDSKVHGSLGRMCI